MIAPGALAGEDHRPLADRLRAWVGSARAGVAMAVASRSALVVYCVFAIMPPAVLAAVWLRAAAENQGSVVGYTGTALVWYIAFSEAAILPIRIRMIEEVGDDIGSGRIAIELLRPASILPIRLANEVGRTAPRLGLSLALAAIVGILLGGLPPSASGLALAIPALVFAIILNLVAQYLFAAAAFWVGDTKGTWFLYQKLVFVLGGMLLPLEVLPPALETFARFLPFMAMAYVPARLAAGFVEPELLLIQTFWLVAMGFAAATVFRAGEHRLLTTGG